ncbi:MAG TPA: HNH endonuclease signature motif containing protein [Xanthobacteraceae bacterium]|jgi:hypothetical protein
MLSERKLRLTAEQVRKLLHYAPETGLFYWRVSRGGAAAGTQAGSPHAHGYVVIRLDGVNHYAHRLAWLYVHGEHPTEEVDHRNGNRADNRIANLRQSSRAQNAQNTWRRYRTTGFKGVDWHRRKWRARIVVSGTRIHIGYYPTAEKAAAAYDEAARLHYGEFARTNEMAGLLPPRRCESESVTPCAPVRTEPQRRTIGTGVPPEADSPPPRPPAAAHAGAAGG